MWRDLTDRMPAFAHLAARGLYIGPGAFAVQPLGASGWRKGRGRSDHNTADAGAPAGALRALVQAGPKRSVKSVAEGAL